MGNDGLTGVDLKASPFGFDQEHPLQHDGKLIEAGSLPRLFPTSRALHPGDAHPLCSGVDPPDELLDQLCRRPLIEKVRYKIPHAGLTWEVDDFEGENAGLVIMEVELEREDQSVELPDWVGEEVTGDPRYYNASLIGNPYSQW